MEYIAQHRQVKDVLFTGGDPMVMTSEMIRAYVNPLLNNPATSHLDTIRIGTKSLAYWRKIYFPTAKPWFLVLGLRPVSGAKEKWSALYGVPALETAPTFFSSLAPSPNSAFSHANSLIAYRFTTDPEATTTLKYFEEIVSSGKHLTIQAHFTHPRELETLEVQEAMRLIRKTGANIRTQSPLVRGINDSAPVWTEMWNQQVKLGAIPYYM